jgi:hypothetical protein
MDPKIWKPKEIKTKKTWPKCKRNGGQRTGKSGGSACMRKRSLSACPTCRALLCMGDTSCPASPICHARLQLALGLPPVFLLFTPSLSGHCCHSSAAQPGSQVTTTVIITSYPPQPTPRPPSRLSTLSLI